MAEAPPAGQKFPIVGVGASAGGIEAFTELLKALPQSPAMAIIFVLHQDPTHESHLAQVVGRSTNVPIEVIRDATAVEPGRLYLAPPNAEVSISDGVLHLHERTPGAALIDAFFRSLAEDQGRYAISVVLSGMASDGALGTREIKAEGGITFAQDETAKMDGMPQAAIASGFVDFVLPPAAIAKELVRISRHSYLHETSRPDLSESDLRKLFKLMRTRHDTDFTQYKPMTIERRIRRRLALRKVNTLEEYLRILHDDPEEAEQLYSDILIKVTGFFRDREVFSALEKIVFPELLRDRNESVRAWVPGCATGEEAYSLAISMLETASEVGSGCPIQIFGTDISEAAVERARAGVYPDSIAGEMSPDRLQRFFTKVDGGYRISKAVRDCCIFARQNVTTDPPFSKLDLISCRNVMIYFGPSLQRKVITMFHYALRPDAFLVLGSSESIGNFGELFAPVDRKNKIYRKKATAQPRLELEFTKMPIPIERDTETHEEQPNAVIREAERLLLSRFSPPGVLINDNLDVLQFRGRMSRFLELPTGTASFNVLKMAREGLLADLSAAIHAARKKGEPERREGVPVQSDHDTIDVNLEVIPFIGASKERFMLVLFDEQQPEKEPRGRKKTKEPRTTPQMARLKRELQATREYLQSIIEEQEAMNEELRTAGEEVQSTNEELQTTNEELETAKEELHSSNEELTTLNEELQNRNEELAQTNNDLINLLTSIEIPILMLDSRLRIRRFNPSAERKLNLVPADIGRPIDDINTKLPLEHLDRMIQKVIDTLEVREVEIKHRDGRLQSLRIRPYVTADRKIDGAVLTLIDLEEFLKGKKAGG